MDLAEYRAQDFHFSTMMLSSVVFDSMLEEALDLLDELEKQLEFSKGCPICERHRAQPPTETETQGDER